MPKSRHGKGRYQPIKKKIIQPTSTAAVAAQPAESRQQAGAAPVKAAVRASTVKTAAAPVMQYPYIISDLIKIGVVAGIIIVIMIILALIFS